jgi:hypothetical protein
VDEDGGVGVAADLVVADDVAAVAVPVVVAHDKDVQGCPLPL